eukprot:3296404-Pleurochrysis_carterae.AAC.3
MAGNSSGAEMATAIIEEEKKQIADFKESFDEDRCDSTVMRMTSEDERQRPRKPSTLGEVMAGNTLTEVNCEESLLQMKADCNKA